MDKSNKNRTDLLAAGRKKLQQFRKKKDNKGSSSSSSHGKKSSSKASKHEIDSDTEEQAKISSIHEKMDEEELTTVAVDHQEADHSDSQQCNGDSTTDGGGDISNSEIELLQEMDESSFLPEMSSEGAIGAPDSSKAENRRDGSQISREYNIERSGLGAENTAFAEEATPSSILSSDLDQQSSSLDIQSTNGEDSAIDVDDEQERRHSEDSSAIYISQHGRTQQETEPLQLNQEIKVSSKDTSYKPEETALTESSLVPCESDDFLAAERNFSVAADEEGKRRSDVILQLRRFEEANASSTPDRVLREDATSLSSSEGNPANEGGGGAVVAIEEYLQQTGRTQGAISSSVISEVLPEVNTILSDMPGETTYIVEKLDSIQSSIEDIPVIKSLDGSVIADTNEERSTTGGSVLQASPWESTPAESKSFEKLREHGVMSLMEKADGIDTEDHQLISSNNEVESISNLLYITTVERDVLQMQLDEQMELNTQNSLQSLDEVSKFSDLVKETQKSKGMADEELEQLKSGLQAMSIAKEELETQCVSMKGEMEEFRIRGYELQNRLEQSQEGLSHALVELTNCRVSLEILQEENLHLTEYLLSKEHEKRKVKEESELVSSENKRLSSEILERRQQLLSALDKHTQLQSELRDTGAYIEQLAEENMHLSSSLEVHKEKMKELNGSCTDLPSQPQESGRQGTFLLQKNDEECHGHSGLFGVLKQQLEDASSILHNLNESVDSMHSNSVYLSRSDGRVAAPGVSNIIQAFESKAPHHVEDVIDLELVNEGGCLEDLYALTKEQISSLRDILLQMKVGADTHVTKQPNTGEHMGKLEMGCITENQESRILQDRIDQLAVEVSSYKSKIIYMQNQIDEMEQTANEEVARLLSQIEMLQNDINDTVFILKQDTDSIRAATIEAIGKLNASTIFQMSDGLDIGSHVISSVDAAVLVIKSLNEKLEESHINYHTLETSYDELNKCFIDMQGRNELALELLKKIYRSLKEFVYYSYQNIGEALVDADTDDNLQLLYGNYDRLIGHLQKVVDEHHQLVYANNELKSSMLNKNHEIEELNLRCNSLSQQLDSEYRSKDAIESSLMDRNRTYEELGNGVLALAHKLESYILSENIDASYIFTKSDSMKSDLSRLDSLVSFHLQNYGEVVEEINSAKNCLHEVNIDTDISADKWSLPLPILLRQEFVPKVSKLQEELQLLSTLNLQQETEIHSLKDGLSKLEEDLKASRSEMNSKISELEQSEQRLSSVREKLSIAVSKGKGLIVQRDSLKQSLEEKTGELEKCMQELQSKETMLHEVEAKLKSYSDADRVESLESELSYIRNSATALRDSFLLKDSVLQRIEEILEDLDLPDNFHSKDTVEKIELLSRLVAGNSSFPVTDSNNKSSEATLKSDIQLSSNQEMDELKRKYEELQSKFYGLAEHYDILEQSLLERNSLVQKWEEMLDRIDIPSHLKSLDPEDRIESLGREFYDIQVERDNLHHKIENLEDSSDMLIIDLEESHKKISELSAEVVTVKSERDFFSESLDKLRFQYLALSEKAVHDELERENLERELAELQEKLVKKVEDTENEIQKLHDLVRTALPEGDDSEILSGEDGIASLGALLRKLLSKYALISSDKSVNIVADKLEISEKDEEFLGLRSELEEVSQSLVLVKGERDTAIEKCHSFMLEIEEITREMNLLQKERSGDMEKYHSLGLELEAVSKQRDNFQEKLSQEEQKSAATREKLNVAVRKGKALVQQRDALKQTIEEMTTSVECLKAEHNQRVEALESEKSSLMNQLAESEQNLQERSQKFSRLLAAVHSIEIGIEVNIVDPVQKMEEIGKHSRGLHSSLVSAEQEAKKSKQAAELLLTELNEVQDRADILQEELDKVQAAILESNKQKHDAEVAKVDAQSSLEQFTSIHFEERKNQVNSLVELKSSIDQLGKGCSEFSSLVSNLFEKKANLLSYVQSFLESITKQMNGEVVDELPVLGSRILSINPIIEDNSLAVADIWPFEMNSHVDDSSITEFLAHACSSLHEYTRKYDSLKDKAYQEFFSIRQEATCLLEAVETVKRNLGPQNDFSESLKRDIKNLELVIRDKDNEIQSMRRNLYLLYEACRCSIVEIENKKAQTVENNFPLEGHDDGHIVSYTDQSIEMMADSLLSAVKGSTKISELAESNQRELKASMLDLQRGLQEKDIEIKKISEDLVSQIREAEALANRYAKDLDSSRAQVSGLEKKVSAMENDKQLLESRVSELPNCEDASKDLQDRLISLTNSIAAKDQEIDDLMQALDEEELKMEALENRNKELEDIVHEKILALENLETSREKALAKLSTTMSKFDELRNLSESLLTEVESLQSQLQTRDSEISFLRQEVTRCTNDVLASQETNQRYLSDTNELLTWMQMMASRFGEPHILTEDKNSSQTHVFTDILDKKIASLLNELEDLRVTVQSKESMLQIERGKVPELLCKTEDIQTKHGKEIQREPFQEERDSVKPSSLSSTGSVEIEQMVQRNKVSSPPVMTHIRSGRKVNNDQIAIAIDMENDDNKLDDEDDDKAHGFKSLTMSRLVPRATRPISDRIDGIWVSVERLLMRQPSLRLGVIIYWVVLHALLASFI